MAQTHQDADAGPFMERLTDRARENVAAGKSKLASGNPGEPILEEWQARGVHVRKMPDDEQGILRVSVGGGQTPVPLNYLTFRGDLGECVDLLRTALAALEQGGDG